MEKDPECFLQQEMDGDHHLHRALKQKSSFDVISFLLRSFLKGAQAKAGLDDLFPLYMAIENCASLEVVQLLINEFPEAIRTPNKAVNVPLHAAMNAKSHLPVVNLLLEVYPEAMSRPGDNNNLPAHLVASNSSSLEMVEFIVEKFPTDVQLSNASSNLLLHLALEAEHFSGRSRIPHQVLNFRTPCGQATTTMTYPSI